MTYQLTWLPEVLLGAGLKVAEVPGWRTRGRGDMGRVQAVTLHHTATSRQGNYPSLALVRDGRGPPNALPGPLCHVGLGRDGTWYVVAAGRANHAGSGNYRGMTDGNGQSIGIEAENNGVGEKWPAVQLESYKHGCAAMLKKIGANPIMCHGHREYTRRKIDPTGINMDAFRYDVGVIMGGLAPHPVLVPPLDAKQRPTLFRGSKGPLVIVVQKVLEVNPDGKYGPATESAVRKFQRECDLVPDGRVGPKTWEAIDEEEK